MKKKKHHYIPASYLAGFTDKKDRTGQIYVYDKKENKIYKNSVENVAYKKGYYHININGLDEDIVEDEFVKIETRGIFIVRKMVHE